MSQLIDILEQKRKNNENAISYVAQEKPNSEVEIELFGPSVVKVDSDIVSLVSQINDLKAEIVVLSLSAFNVGCGTTVAATTVFPDRVVSKTPNYSSSTYSGNDPYGNTDNTLSSSNVGIGSFLVYNQDDSSQVGLGSLFADIGACYRSPCTSSVCVSHGSSITALQDRIDILQNQVSNLIPKSNAIKEQRSESEIVRYGYNQTSRVLTEKNAQIDLAIKTVKDLSPDT